MIRRLSVLVVLALAGCLSSPSSEEAFAPSTRFHSEIAMCRERNACDLLCMAVFEVPPQDIAACRITRTQADGAWVRIHYYSGDDGGFGVDYDDGGSPDYDETPPPPSEDPPAPDDETDEPDDDPEPDDDDGYDGSEETP